MANENLKKQMVVKLGTTTNTEAQLISNMVDGALSGKGGNDPELENLKKQMVIKLGTTTNEDAQIISNMVDNAAGGGGGSSDIKAYDVKIINTSSNSRYIPLTPGNSTLAVDNNGFIYDNTTAVTINPGEEKIIKFLGKNPYDDAPESINYRIIATGTLTSSDSEESVSLITDLNNVRIESVSDYGMYTFYPVIIDTTQPASFTFDIKMLPGLPGM